MIHPQGTMQNAQPHLLIGTVRIDSYGGSIEWSLQCPYEGLRPCGFIEPCDGTPADAEKWGCAPCPPAPPFPDGLKSLIGMAWGRLPEDYRKQVEEWDAVRERWRDQHESAGDGEYGHRTDRCWYEYYLREGDMEPEEILGGLPAGTILTSPMKVLIGTEGYADEPTVKFSLWKDPDAQTD